MNTNIKLSDTQLAILATAAAREDLAVLPTPGTLKARGGALQVVLTSLIERELIEERLAAKDAPEWRRDEDGRRLSLTITNAGLEAIGLGEEGDPDGPAGKNADGMQGEETVAAELKACVAASARLGRVASQGDCGSPSNGELNAGQGGEPAAGRRDLRTGSKGAIVLDLLRRERGASVEEMMAQSGWQAHSVRGFVSGTVKKKLGLEIASSKDDAGARRYRVV